jgi:ribosomal protein L12E/L44/L45/RPP1/RPP2
MDSSDFDTTNPDSLYAQMRPDQRTVIANEFIRVLTIAGDPALEQLRQEIEDSEEYEPPQASNPEDERAAVHTVATSEHPVRVTVEQVSRLHTYTREHHPDLFEQVMRHPVTEATLAAPGAPESTDEHDDAAKGEQAEEAAQEEREEELMNEPSPPEDDLLMRTPMERGARPGGDLAGGDTLNRPEPIAPEEP